LVLRFVQIHYSARQIIAQIDGLNVPANKVKDKRRFISHWPWRRQNVGRRIILMIHPIIMTVAGFLKSMGGQKYDLQLTLLLAMKQVVTNYHQGMSYES
jgi:hypothetical protein